MQQIRRKERGFTIIELVVVILLLGILAAVALPRFINVTDQAHESVVEGVFGALASGTAMARAQYMADGQPTSGITLEGIPLPMAAGGYPAISGAASCGTIWEGLLQVGRPGLEVGANVTTVGSGVTADDLVTAAANADGADFYSLYDPDTGATPEVPSCYFIYTAQYGEQTDAQGTDAVSVIQFSQDGELNLIRL